MVNYTKRAARGFGIIFIVSLLSEAVAYLTRIVLARNLSPAEYGLFYAVFTFIIFFLFFRDLGLGSALVKYIAEFKVSEKHNAIKTAIVSVVSFQFLSSLVFGLVFFFLAGFLSERYFKNPLSASILQMLVLYILLSISFIDLKSIFQAFQKFKIFSLVEFSKNLIVLLLILVFFALGIKNAFAPAYAYVLACAALFFIFLPSALKTFPFFKYKVEEFWPVTKKLFLFGIPVLVTSIGIKIIGYIDTLMLTGLRSLAEVGVYNVILPSALLFSHLSSSISAVAFPIVSELWAKQDKKRLSDGLRILHKYAFVLTIPVILTVFAFSQLFIKLLFGEAYISGALAMQILLIGVLLYSVAGINHNILSGIGKPAIVTEIILFAALINFAANIILIPRFGIEGAAVATTLSYLLALLLSTYYVTKFAEVKFPKKIWLKLSFAGIVFVLVIYSLKNLLVLNVWLELVITFGAASLAYLILIYVLRIIDVGEIKKYLSLIRR